MSEQGLAQDHATQRILGVPFFRGTVDDAVRHACAGGLAVFPAAPALKDITTDAAYREALLNADLVLADSAFMVLCWRLLQRESVDRISGLAYLRELLRLPAMKRAGAAFWVMSSEEDARRNSAWLTGQGMILSAADVYVAPVYGLFVEDERLLATLEERRPGHVFLTVGGGKQEKLGHYLLERLSYRPAIHCVGAAISFLSGGQVPIPVWADRFYLGWLFRVAGSPRQFGRRYWEARALFTLIRRYGQTLPPLETDRFASFPEGRGSSQV